MRWGYGWRKGQELSRRTKDTFHSLYCCLELTPNGLRNLKTIYKLLCRFDRVFPLEAGNNGGLKKGKQWKVTQTVVLFFFSPTGDLLKSLPSLSWKQLILVMILVINIGVPHLNLCRQNILLGKIHLKKLFGYLWHSKDRRFPLLRPIWIITWQILRVSGYSVCYLISIKIF